MVQDCTMELGTNATVKYGLQTVHSDGVVVLPISIGKSAENNIEFIVRRVWLSEKTQLALGKSRWAKVKVEPSSYCTRRVVLEKCALSLQRRLSLQLSHVTL